MADSAAIGLDIPVTIDVRLDSEQLTGAGGATVQRERIQIGGPLLADIAGVDATNGLDVDVTRLPALVAGTANIGDVDVLTLPALVAGTANIGDVDIASIATVTGSGSLTAAAQAVTLTLAGAANATWQLTGVFDATVSFEASNDNTNWVAIWAYQAGTGTIVQGTTTTGIYRNTTAGFGYVRARCSAYTSGTVTVTAIASQETSGVFINFPMYGAQQIGKQEDIASADADTGIPAMAVQKATPANTAGGDGDYEFLQMSAGRLWTSATVTAVPAPLSTTGAGVVATALRTTLGSDDPAVASLSVMDDWDETNRAAVNTIAGQVGVQGAAGASTALTQRIAIATDANAITAVGTIADDATTPGAPVMVGGFAISPDGTDPGSVSAEADVARFRTDLNRRVLVNTAHPNHWSYHLNTSTAQTDTSVAADPGDGFQLVVTDIVFSSGAATAINMFLEEGASTVLGPYYLEAVAGRGMALHFTTGKFITASTALTITTSASIAHTVDIMGYIQAV